MPRRSYGLQRDYSKRVCVGNSLTVIKKLPENRKDESCIGACILDLNSLRKRFKNCVFLHIQRQGNQVAHLLAIEGLRGEMNTYLLNGLSNFIEEAVEKDRWGTVGGVSLVL
ncbi:hypothetical protein PVK06_035749 [Gossypium arboreum]|uniref:RNase H type-1 domain-containing protein n=1 Tax=Gossypium arboreum TaxID=29729 RepID=A0ABR0NHN4_GOSAR|nr:hypothetical protein PVK06_035749 [Gossypium arboreum]